MEESEYLSFVKGIVSKHYNIASSEFDQLFSAGCLGFVKALRDYKPEFKRKFPSYAYTRVLGEVKDYLRTQYSDKSRAENKRGKLIYSSEDMSTNYSKEFDETYLIESLKRKARKKGLLISVYNRHISNKTYVEQAKEAGLSFANLWYRLENHNSFEEFENLVKEELENITV